VDQLDGAAVAVERLFDDGEVVSRDIEGVGVDVDAEDAGGAGVGAC